MGGPKQLPFDTVATALGPLLEDASIVKSTHDGKRLEVLLRHNQLALGGVGYDTMLASYLIDPEARHGLGE